MNINSVYTTVLAILNKENRGYIPPFDFNKIAKQAQLEIFEAYFYDLAHFSVSQKGKVYDTGYSNITKAIKEKIDIFEKTATLDYLDGRFLAPSDLYRIDTLVYINTAGKRTNVEEMDKHNSTYVIESKKTTPSVTYPKFLRLENNFQVFPDTIATGVEAFYIRKPLDPDWGFLEVKSGEPLYDESVSQDFELHPSDEYKLVQKILQLSGVIVREADIAAFATQDLAADMQTEKQ